MKSATVVALLLACAPAFADGDDTQEKGQARVLLGQGNALFEHGDLKGALADFRAAYALYPSPKLLVNAAAAERELGDLAGAANDLRHFLDDAADEDPFLVDRSRQDLRALEKRLARVSLSGWPRGSTVEVDGRPARDPAYVRPGEHHVRVRAPSGEVEERDVDLGAGEAADVPMTARALVAASGAPHAAPHKNHGWIAAVVIGGALVIGGAIAVGLLVGGTGTTAQPLQGALGTFKFSDFH